LGILSFIFFVIMCMDNIEYFHFVSFFYFSVHVRQRMYLQLQRWLSSYSFSPFYCSFNSWLTAFASIKAWRIIFTMFIIFIPPFIVGLVLLQLLVRLLTPRRLLLRFLSSGLFPLFVYLLLTSLLYKEARFRTIAFHYVNITVV
jgi:hypothetical protein